MRRTTCTVWRVERGSNPARPHLVIGTTCLVHGVYFDHWEIAHLSIGSFHRTAIARRRSRRAELSLAEAVPSVFVAAGLPPPDARRRTRPVRFAVEAVVTPLEKGRFGHHGICGWHLRVDEWIGVTPIP